MDINYCELKKGNCIAKNLSSCYCILKEEEEEKKEEEKNTK